MDQDDAILVGSACGGFDFYAKKRGSDEYVWLGTEESSDVDVYSDGNFDAGDKKLQKIDKNKFKTSWLGFEFPYMENGQLHIPEDKSYLCWNIAKRLKLSIEDKLNMKGQIFDIYDKDKKFLFELIFVPIGKSFFYKQKIILKPTVDYK